MSIISLKRDIRRIRRRKCINFELIDYNEAMNRHRARLAIVTEEKLTLGFDQIDKMRQSGKPSIPSTKQARKEIRQRSKEAKELLSNDTPKLWERDQATIDASRYKHFLPDNPLETYPPCGKTPKEMWDHYCSFNDRLRQKKIDDDQTLENKKIMELAEMNKKHGKPIKLHPAFGNTTPRYYTPEFEGEQMGWLYSHLFPYEDFPDHDGKSIIELGDEK